MVDIQRARANLINREEIRREARRRRFEAASRDFAKIVEMIIDRYSPNRIVQWGSLLSAHP